MEHSYLQENLDVLKIRQPGLAKKLGAMAPGNEHDVLLTPDGLPVLVRQGISLHSRINPLSEGSSLADSPEVKTLLAAGKRPLIFGFGTGYHLWPLSAMFDSVLVYEPDPQTLFMAFSIADFRPILPRLHVAVPGDELSPALIGTAGIIAHKPTERCFPAELARLESTIKRPAGPAVRTRAHGSFKFLIVPPIYGGSLPMAGYVSKALEEMGHTTASADFQHLRPIHKATLDPEQAAGPRHRLADSLLRFCGDYIHFLAETEQPDILFALAQAPLDVRSLARIRKRGIVTAFWFVEDHRHFPYYKNVAGSYDFFFHIQDGIMDRLLKSCGAPRCFYLPPAADPAIFHPKTDDADLAPYRCRLSFMGAGYPNRRQLFRELTSYGLNIWGTGWEAEPGLLDCIQQNGRRVPHRTTALIYNAADINLNLHSSLSDRLIDTDGAFVNPRTFEIAACGAFQLTDNRPLLGRHFDLSNEMATFSSPADLHQKITYFMEHPDERRRIAMNARDRVLQEHTYRHRMESAIGVMSSG